MFAALSGKSCGRRRFGGRGALLQEILHVQQDELVVIRHIGLAAGGEREVVVVADDDVVSVHHVHVLDGEEREGQHAVVQRLARQLVRSRMFIRSI